MPQTVTMPNGEVHNFPDEATPEMIAGALGVQGPAAAAPQGPPPEQIGGMGRVWQGVKDVPNGMAQLALHGAQELPDSWIDAVPGLRGADKYLDTDLHNQEQNYQARRAASGSDGIDWARMGGNIVGSAPIAAALPGSAATTLAGRAGAGILQGAASGAVQPDFDAQNGGFWGDKAWQAGGGAVTGGIVNPALGAAGAMIAPKLAPGAQKLMDEGITLTPGQLLGGRLKTTEEKLTSIPGVGDAISNAYSRGLEQFNKAALNRALEPIGETVSKTGRSGVEEVKTKLGDAYSAVLPRLTLKLDDQLATGIEDAKNTLLPTQQKKFDEIMQQQFEKFGGKDSITGDVLKNFESEVKGHASNYLGDASADERSIGKALNQVNDHIRVNLQNSNPADADLLQRINQGYANFVPLRSAGQAVKSDGGFTPQQLATAIRQSDGSVGNGAFATGNARMQDLSDPAVELLANKFPESGTSARHMMEMAIAAAAGHGAGVPPEATFGLAALNGAASVPYLSDGTMKLTQALLSKRPGFARPVSDAAQSLAPYISAGVAGYGQK